jgi:CRP-like cAMP-binding protein
MAPAAADDLAGIPLFATLEPDEQAAIAPWFELEDVSPGVKLTGEGASGYSFYVLRDGAATVSIDGREVRTLGPGDFFGELALLGDGRRTADGDGDYRRSLAGARSLRYRVPSAPADVSGARLADRVGSPRDRTSCVAADAPRRPNPRAYDLRVAVEILYCPV